MYISSNAVHLYKKFVRILPNQKVHLKISTIDLQLQNNKIYIYIYTTNYKLFYNYKINDYYIINYYSVLTENIRKYNVDVFIYYIVNLLCANYLILARLSLEQESAYISWKLEAGSSILEKPRTRCGTMQRNCNIRLRMHVTDTGHVQSRLPC